MKRTLFYTSLILLLIFFGCDDAVNHENAIDDSPLPTAIKGYELYSWPDGDRWQFTLITGTDRNKSFDEIYTEGNEILDDGWVKIREDGIDGIIRTLERLPAGEAVFWHDDRFLSGDQGNMPDISYPDSGTIEDIELHCRQAGLHLSGFYRTNSE